MTPAEDAAIDAVIDSLYGWTVDDIDGYGVVLHRPGSGGFVTLDFKERIFCFGMSRPRRGPDNQCHFLFTGRNWRKEFVQHAVDKLNEAMA